MFNGKSTVNQLLLHRCSARCYQTSRCHHQATRSAAQTQTVLPSHVSVQKTLTARTSSGTLLLITGIGDFRFSKDDKRAIGDALGKRQDITLNPPDILALNIFEQEHGEVTPFLPGDLLSDFAAIYLMDEETPHTHVAISLSLYESLVLTRSDFLELRQWYLKTYGDCRLISRMSLTAVE